MLPYPDKLNKVDIIVQKIEARDIFLVNYEPGTKT